jgi:hypothetical protein
MAQTGTGTGKKKNPVINLYNGKMMIWVYSEHVVLVAENKDSQNTVTFTNELSLILMSEAVSCYSYQMRGSEYSQ